MKITEIITEGRGADLYHGMLPDKALSVFANDSMPANWQHDIPGMGRVNGNSFSRNKFYGTIYYDGGYSLRLVLDEAKLAQAHKIFPINGELIHRLAMSNNIRRDTGVPIRTDTRDMPPEASDRAKPAESQMSEEFVVGNIVNLHRYIKSIELFNAAAHSSTPFAYALINYAKKFNIPVTGDPEALDAIRKMNNTAKRHVKAGDKSNWYAPATHPDPAKIAARWEKYHNNPPPAQSD